MFTIPDVSLMKKKTRKIAVIALSKVRSCGAGKYKRFWIARIQYVNTVIVNIVVIVNIIAVLLL